MVGDLRQYVAQPGLRGDAFERCRRAKRVDGGRTFAAPVGASEKVVGPDDGDATYNKKEKI